jgi:hypothetical protein
VLVLAFASSAFATITGTGFDYDWKMPKPNPINFVIFKSAGLSQTSKLMRSDGYSNWTNQDLTLESLSGYYYTDADGSSEAHSVPATFSVNGSAPQTFTAPVTFTAEGTYTVNAGSIDGSGTPFEWTIENWVHDGIVGGIDRTKPTVACNAVPVYNGEATITVSEADSLAGVRAIFVSLDGGGYWGRSFYRSQMPTGSLDVTAGVGSHTLDFHAYDFAGNFVLGKRVSFSVNPIGYKPKLSMVTVGVKGHRVSFRGTVTPAATRATVKLVVDRKVDGVWKYGYATYFVPLHKYASSFWMRTKIGRHGTYRVRAYEGTGKSPKSTVFEI